MRPHRSALTLSLCLAAGPALAATSPCRVDPFQMSIGSDAATHMVVRSGATCGVSFGQRSTGRSIAAGGINHVAVAEQASHGQAGTSGTSTWGYRSQKGYTGKDRFVIEAGGEVLYDRVIRGTSHVTVDVDVVP